MTDTEITVVTARLSTLDRFLPVWIAAGHGRRACSSAASSPT